ncbi:MAG: hypothetical protein HY235_02750 [Acidobacteria bacterium]|nr:hypothetical protein [Acidobacteriota bacterium]
MIPFPASRERVVVSPKDRLEAVLEMIRSAEQRLSLTVFRCSEMQVLASIAGAIHRGVAVQVLFTPRAKGWKKRLAEVRNFLECMGAQVRSYAGEAKYHAKYMVADGKVALVTSSNFTGKCFRSTSDFTLLTGDPLLVRDLDDLFQADWSNQRYTPSGRLIISPENARPKMAQLFRDARRSIRVIDHKLSDRAMLSVLQVERRRGVGVVVLGQGAIPGLESHGKLFVIDQKIAVIGSLSLSASSMDSRREVSVIVEDRASVRQLNAFFEAAAFERRKERAA